jgi:hypothetical protein
MSVTDPAPPRPPLLSSVTMLLLIGVGLTRYRPGRVCLGRAKPSPPARFLRGIPAWEAHKLRTPGSVFLRSCRERQ